MYINSIKLGSIISATFLIVSCDTDKALSPSQVLEERAEPLDSFEESDNLFLTPITAETPTGSSLITRLTLDGITGTTFDESTDYIYAPDGQFGFSFTSDFDNVANLNEAIQISLEGSTPLGARLRELLLSLDGSDPTPEELLEIITILNNSGAALEIDPDRPRIPRSIGQIALFGATTSTFADTLDGFMAGNYLINTSGFEVGFRDGVTDEFRFITPFHKIPFVTTTPYFNENTETGRFRFEFGNNGANF